MQSLAVQTAHYTDTREAFLGQFEARLSALANAHNLLTDARWEGAALRDLLLQELAPFQLAAEPRFTIEGADVTLRPQAALALGMAFHELATNAAKYGGLSTPSGRVRVSWEIAQASAARLRLRWTEIGGPPAREPAREGFGLRLIKRGLAHELAAEVRVEFDPTGLRCSIEIPLDELVTGRADSV